MDRDRITIGESIKQNEGFWVKMEMETTIRPDETETEAYRRAKEKINAAYKELYLMTTQSWLDPIINGSGIAQQTIQPTIIDRSIERLEILIDDCKTMAELDKVRANNLDKIKSAKSLNDLCEKRFAELINT